MKSNPERVARLAIAGGLLAVLAACSALSSIAPRQRWNQKWGPMVPHTTFPTTCDLCHVAERWDVIKDDFSFDHLEETGVPLLGAHDEAACIRCHNDRGPVKAYVQRGCGGCHADPHQGALGVDCESCHDEYTNWAAVGMIADHSSTRFPLIGTHAITPCENCHQNSSIGTYRDAPAQCHLCHQDEALAANFPHAINGWNIGCNQCHNPLSWDAPLFDHAFFPLQGGHGGLDCTQCHPSGQVAGCHEVDYLTAPNHVALGYSTDCSQCHPITVWQDGTPP